MAFGDPEDVARFKATSDSLIDKIDRWVTFVNITLAVNTIVIVLIIVYLVTRS